ncbi:hypothetical protein EJB05_40359 [Eragrostis curvula]|uniref:Ubiquitinyl hydrolase 1 n=1 Tax=Eragrostis curvula TaxID=38414 RepID=A0A5J9TRH4_9POAL|nr:hypothetical protein EJB05_40359 [Eragrostis curvula]
MATRPGTPEKEEDKGKNIKFVRFVPPRARSSGDGDDSEDTPPTLPPLPRLPLAQPSSPPGPVTVVRGKQLSLLRAQLASSAYGDSDEVDEEDHEDSDEEDHEDSDEEEDYQELERSSEKDFSCLVMSCQRNTPQYIPRYGSNPLTKHEYFSLQTNWRHLLAGKRTYLRPPKGYPVHNDVFPCPLPQLEAMTRQEPIEILIRESSKNSIIQKKIKEHIGQMHDAQSEFTRLMEYVAASRDYFVCIQWDKAYFSNPEAYFSSVSSEFKHLVHLAANGISADDLYKTNLRETMPSRILSLLRLLTEVEIRAREAQYRPFFTEKKTAIEFCMTEVRPMDVEADDIQIRALSNALGIPLRVEVAGAGSRFGIVQVQCQDFFPRSESVGGSTSGPVHSSKSYSSPSKKDEPLEQQRDNDSVEQASASTCASLLSSDGIPLVTLLCTPGQYDILYRKQI